MLNGLGDYLPKEYDREFCFDCGKLKPADQFDPMRSDGCYDDCVQKFKEEGE